MTLLIDEIHVLGGDLRNSLILQACDRRITVNGKYHSNRRKLFAIPHLKGAVGYFGLAQMNSTTFLSEWLPGFIHRASTLKSLDDFANGLHKELNRTVDKALLANNPSGFHICGYNPHCYPEFWFIRNIRGMSGHLYEDFKRDYTITEDFLQRDARPMGYDGVNPSVPHRFRQYYVNGDVRSYHAIWNQLDPFLDTMLAQPDFTAPKHPADLEKRAQWKLKAIASFYGQFAKRKTIGTPVDTLIVTP